MRILLSAGEPSGAQRARELAEELLRLEPSLEIVSAGVPAGKQVLGLPSPVIGFQEALKELGSLKGRLKALSRLSGTCDAAVLVDYPGFHLCLARSSNAKNLVYYIPPQVWAWGTWRVRALTRRFRLVLSTLPFEARLLKSWGVRAEFVGHPLLDALREVKPLEIEGSPVFALLPGSRPKEVRRHLPRFLRVREELRKLFPKAKFIISLIGEFFLEPAEDTLVVRGQGPRALASADAALVASGTASLEAGLLGTPAVVAYTVSEATYWLARALAKVPYISLVNLTLGEMVFPECIQHFDPVKIAGELAELFWERERVQAKLRRLWELLGPPGAARRAAERVLSIISRSQW